MHNSYVDFINENRNEKLSDKQDQHKNKKDYRAFNLDDPAPEFKLQGIVNGEPKMVSLSDYRGKWVVVFFYGSDFTFV